MAKILQVTDTQSILVEASAQAKQMLNDAFTRVKQYQDTAAGDPPKPDKFFPNGIELIYVKVEAGLTEKTKVTVELRIAGEKGVKGLADGIENTESNPGSVG
ncbi:hypothetical protein [Hymenobacter sp. BT491]|uniref:hypothetical protein n=1 Tax=Hymenobacter sp. BT491 TaxID=2766779 RepID=UPI001653D377|nr:hypothetical protein [Hymenobacter sp. BT491]MBC6989451.1 hypothetical protein [Hymenobacter sp. BT491]